MPMVPVPMRNGKHWYIAPGELTIPMDALDGMSFEEVAATMRALVVTVRRMTPFLQGGHEFPTYDDWRRFYAAYHEVEMDRLTRHVEEYDEFMQWKKARERE